MKSEDKAWLEWRENFAKVYDQSNYGGSLQGLAMRVSHGFIEKAYNAGCSFEKVLEVGAGTGEHLNYIRHSFDQYVVTDLDEGTLNVAELKLDNKLKGRVVFEKQDAASLSYSDNSFDRLIAVHVLEHIYEPHLVIKEWIRVVKNGGVVSLLLPTDPGIAWRFGRTLGARKNAIRQGFEYDYIMAREHVNSCNNLVALLRHYSSFRIESWWPTRIPSIDLNLFFCCHLKIEK